MANPNWFFYFKKVEGKDTLRDTWPGFKQRLEKSKEDFIKLYQEFMPSVKTGMPDLPPEPTKEEIEAALPPLHRLEVTPENSAVMTEHAWNGEPEQCHPITSLVKDGGSDDDINNKWLCHEHESWVVIDFNEEVKDVAGVGFISGGDCIERDPHTVSVIIEKNDK